MPYDAFAMIRIDASVKRCPFPHESFIILFKGTGYGTPYTRLLAWQVNDASILCIGSVDWQGNRIEWFNGTPYNREHVELAATSYSQAAYIRLYISPTVHSISGHDIITIVGVNSAYQIIYDMIPINNNVPVITDNSVIRLGSASGEYSYEYNEAGDILLKCKFNTHTRIKISTNWIYDLEVDHYE